jgi:hypothetical protein
MRGAHLAQWTGPDVHAECRAAHAAYAARRTDAYRAYFAARRDLKAADHEYKARDLGSALPEGWGELADRLPVSERHQHHLSGNSSQVLALGLLGVAAERKGSLLWLWECLTPLPPAKSNFPPWSFEHTLQPEVLDERPRQTSIDFYVDDPAALLCIEAKWVERGIGECSCRNSGGNPTQGECSARVLEREAYWEVARETFRLPDRQVGRPCPLSFTYQAVRNVAATLALAKPGQKPVFGLIYDAGNPYFAGCGDWPGWPEALRTTLEGTGVDFRAASWQELLSELPLDEATRRWAAEKHGLAPVDDV